LGLLFPIFAKIKNVPSHQPDGNGSGPRPIPRKKGMHSIPQAKKTQTSQHLPSFFQSWYPWDPRGEPLGQFQAANGPLGGTSLDLVQVSHGLNQQRFNQLTYGIQPFNMENQGNHGKLWFIKFNQIKYIDSLYDLCSQN
jgi:hypothetical protein